MIVERCRTATCYSYPDSYNVVSRIFFAFLQVLANNGYSEPFDKVGRKPSCVRAANFWNQCVFRRRYGGQLSDRIRSGCGPLAQLVRAGDSSKRCICAERHKVERDEFRETVAALADGNPEPSRRYTAGRCRDYLRTSVFLMTGLSVPPLTFG